MGLIMLQILKARGVGKIIAIDSRPSALALASELGANHTLNPKHVDVKSEVLNLTNGIGVDLGIEAAGNQFTLDLVTDLVRMEGKLEVFGFHQGQPRTVNWGYWNWMAFQIINGHVRSPRIYVEGMNIGLKLMESGKLKMNKLVTHRFTLDEINQAFEVASAKGEGFIKGVIML
jgi:threonine dehydrogenase-like Zn-dependent dehydrogenase